MNRSSNGLYTDVNPPLSHSQLVWEMNVVAEVQRSLIEFVCRCDVQGAMGLQGLVVQAAACRDIADTALVAHDRELTDFKNSFSLSIAEDKVPPPPSPNHSQNSFANSGFEVHRSFVSCLAFDDCV
jgi:hypothetical protein